MRLVLLTCEQPWQRTLAGRLADKHALALVVVDQHLSVLSRARRIAEQLRRPSTLLRRLRAKMSVVDLDRRDAHIYSQHFGPLGVPAFEASADQVLRASEINSVEISQVVERASPDAIIVSGTRLIRQPVLGCRSRFGMVNLHTGLSPYYRGGPCTFWTLHNEAPEFAGATVHYIAEGIDSGDIILSGRARLEASDGVASLECKVIDLGQRLLLRALDLLEQGRAPRVPQWEKGSVFFYRHFTADARLRLERSLREGLVQRCLERLRIQRPAIRTVDLE